MTFYLRKKIDQIFFNFFQPNENVNSCKFIHNKICKKLGKFDCLLKQFYSYVGVNWTLLITNEIVVLVYSLAFFNQKNFSMPVSVMFNAVMLLLLLVYAPEIPHSKVIYNFFNVLYALYIFI